ncbi:MAG: tyrosine-type recombinase/integrase [Rhizobiaceae bacterium]
MPKLNLTDAFVRSAPSVPGKTVEYADQKSPGLALRVTASGAKSWTFRYRNLAGEQRRLSLGKLETTSLAKARSSAILERARVESREDPVAIRKQAKADARRPVPIQTVSEIGAAYFAACGVGRHRPNAKRAKRPSTIDLEGSYFRRHVLPEFGSDKLADLNRQRIQAFIDRLAAGSRSAARQAKVVLHSIFNFAMWHELADSNPCQFLAVPQFAARERTLTHDDLRRFWSGLSSVDTTSDVFVSPGVKLGLELLALTLQRRAEVAGMRKEEVDHVARLWIIPGERTKNHRTHVVPLSEAALERIKQASELSGDSRFVFPSPRDPESSIHPAALSHAFRRICKSAKLKGIRPHDLRRTGATELTSEGLGYSRFVVSQVLNHASDTGGAAAVTGVYDRNSYLSDKRRALEAWAQQLLSIVCRPNLMRE